MHFDFNFTNGTDYILYILNFMINKQAQLLNVINIVRICSKRSINIILIFFLNYFHSIYVYHLYSKIKYFQE